MNNLPIVNVRVKTHFGGEFDEVYDNVDVEVLTVNFNSGSMRIRYVPIDYYGNTEHKMITNIPNDTFFEKFKLNPKN